MQSVVSAKTPVSPPIVSALDRNRPGTTGLRCSRAAPRIAPGQLSERGGLFMNNGCRIMNRARAIRERSSRTLRAE